MSPSLSMIPPDVKKVIKTCRKVETSINPEDPFVEEEDANGVFDCKVAALRVTISGKRGGMA